MIMVRKEGEYVTPDDMITGKCYQNGQSLK